MAAIPAHEPSPRRSRELPIADGFGSLTLAPAANHRRPASRFFCLEAPLSWRPARPARRLTTPPTSSATSGVRPAAPAITIVR
ncbi:MAG: hypothetical protein WBW84_14080 [Acidobacteriaceae bacterium]